MKTILTCFICFVFSNSILAQKQNFGIFETAGISGISLSDHKITPKTSFNIGFFAEDRIIDSGFIRLEIIWMQFNSYEVAEGLFTAVLKKKEDYARDGIYNQGAETMLNYLAMPIWIRVPVNRFSLKSGLKVMVFMKGNSTFNHVEPTYVKHFIVGDQWDSHNIKRVHFGMQMGVDYKINENVNIRLDTSWSIGGMMEKSDRRRHFQLTAGMDFNLKSR